MSNDRKLRVIVSCRFGYLNCWKPGVNLSGTSKYSVAAIISKDDKSTLEKITQALEYVKENYAKVWGGRVPSNLRLPIHDGDVDRPDNPAFKNSYYINAKSKDAPQIVDENVNPIIDQTEVYSGCYGKVSITFFAYNYNGNRGIAAGLGNIQKLADGEAMGGQISAKEDFTPLNCFNS